MKTIPFSPPDITEKEIEAVAKVLRSGWITTGPKTKEFERKLSEYFHTPKTVCLNSATAALELTLRLLGVGKDDEVIVPAYTYTASCSVIEHVGATPVLVDIQKDHFEMDYALLEEAITPRTKVIIPVEIAGYPCDYNKMFEIVQRKKDLFRPNSDLQKQFNRVVIISDSAHAVGTLRENTTTGELADFASYSFHAVKNLTTAEGGCVTWRDQLDLDHEEIYRQFQVLSLHGQTKDALAKMKPGSWEYDIVIPGFKCNMTDIMSAIGLVQLERYPSLLEKRAKLVARYDQGLETEPRVRVLKHDGEHYHSSRHLYITHIVGANHEQRSEIITKMAEKGISCNVHYKPLPLLTAYKNMGFKISDYPNAYRYYENEITLPLHTLLTDEEVDYVVDAFKLSIREVMGE